MVNKFREHLLRGALFFAVAELEWLCSFHYFPERVKQDTSQQADGHNDNSLTQEVNVTAIQVNPSLTMDVEPFPTKLKERKPKLSTYGSTAVREHVLWSVLRKQNKKMRTKNSK